MLGDPRQDDLEIAAAMQLELHGQDILVADDSARMREYHRSVLEMIGIASLPEAADGEEGPERFSSTCRYC
ncbi:MAG: hypothetical protein JSU82_05315 [Rhodospirillales bacterium]|nr:MAG: hypothetical protein JSU82_05315 [Rhodospirillales bacterium]